MFTKVTYNRWRRYIYPYFLVLPSTLLVIGILGYAIGVAFKDSLHRYPKLSFEGTFIGFDNYIKLFQTAHFQNSMAVTFIFVLGTVIVGLLMSFILALCLYNLKNSARIFNTFTLMPYLISGVAAAIIWRFLFNSDAGFINLVIRTFGAEPVRWLSDRRNALVVVTLANIWKIFPMSTMLILAGLQVIDTDLYDAATVDGASSAQTFFRVTLPLISTYLSTSLIWLTFASFNMFTVIYPLTEGGPMRATEVMAVYMYRLAFGELRFSSASAVMIILLTLNIGFSAIIIRVFRSRV